MKEFKITERGYFVGGVEQEIGAMIKADALPATLVNKAVEVEVAEEAPRRGRPPKDRDEK